MAAIALPGKRPVRPTSLRLLPLCLAIAGAVRAEDAPKPTWALCQAPTTLPLFVDPASLPEGDRLASPTDVSAGELNVLEAESTLFSGDVVLTHGDQWMATDKLRYFHKDERYLTEGQVRYQDRTLRFTADKVEGDQKTDQLKLTGVNYQFNEETGNGTAGTAVMQGEVGTLSSATYSTCPPGQRQWEFSSQRISINNQTHTGVAHNATLRIGGIPVIWLPLVSFPTDDKRRTGVLAPTIGRDDRNGLDFKVPVYLNLAPNYDATLTPRWLSKRGLMLGGEFRYLTERSRGHVEATYLPHDQIDADANPLSAQSQVSGDDRSMLSWQHGTVLSRHWFLDADLNNVSDKYYLSDFGDSIAATSISLVSSRAGLYGRGKFWSASLSAESWQIASPLLADGDEPYRRLPRLQASAWRPLARWFEAGVHLEAVRFSHENFGAANAGKYDGGNRLDVQPWIRFPFGGSAWFVTPQLSWRYTRYDGLDGQPVDNGGMPASATRSLPIVSLDAGAYFERGFEWRGSHYIQTLEPRLYYLRVPYRDQDELPLFDTRELTFGWTSLFRDNRFGGADRQSDANQLTLALTTRFLSATDGSEKLSAGLGRITYFDAPRVLLTRDCQPTPTPGCSTPSAPLTNDDGSDWVANIDWQVSDWWQVGVTHQWDPTGKRTDLSSVRTQFRLPHGAIVNAAYRFRRELPNQPGLEQTDLSFVIPVNRNWNLYGRWNYSLRDDAATDPQTIEALAGFEWNSCCVAVRVLGRQYIRSFDSRKNLGLYVEIELNGLGSFGRDTARLLDDAILGYAR
jgi:LPS-assembly protein